MQRAGFRATIGKGSPKEIFDEVEIKVLQEKVKPEAWTNETLKKFMCDQNIGIDCSGLAYYILAAENKSSGNSSLDRHLTFPYNKGLRRLIAKFRPVENANVLTFAYQKNSILVDLKDIQPGDFITMTANQETDQENKVYFLPSSLKRHVHPLVSTPLFACRNKLKKNKSGKRNHIIIVHQIDYQNFVPTTIHYTH